MTHRNISNNVKAALQRGRTAPKTAEGPKAVGHASATCVYTGTLHVGRACGSGFRVYRVDVWAWEACSREMQSVHAVMPRC